MKLKSLCKEYLKDLKLRSKYTTYLKMKSVIDLHILSYLGEKEVEKITTKNILEWKQEVLKKEFSQKYNSMIFLDLCTVYNYGYRIYGIHNVAKQVGNFKRQSVRKLINFWTIEEFNQFIRVVDRPLYRCFFSFLYFTGVRKGEALALKWKDIKSKTIWIDKTYSKGIVGPPKTWSSNRNIVLPDFLYNDILVLKSSKKVTDDEYVFGHIRPIRDTTIERYKNQYCKLANVKQIRIHDFRHSHASLLISQGMDIVTIAERLGHSDIKMTLNTYSHIMPNAQIKIANFLDDLHNKNVKSL